MAVPSMHAFIPFQCDAVLTTTSGEPDYGYAFQEFTGMATQDTYELNFWMTKGDSETPNIFSVYEDPPPASYEVLSKQGEGPTLNGDPPGITDSPAFAWTKYRVRFTPSQAVPTRVGFAYQNDPGYFFVDDASLQLVQSCGTDADCDSSASPSWFCRSGLCAACAGYSHWQVLLAICMLGMLSDMVHHALGVELISTVLPCSAQCTSPSGNFQCSVCLPGSLGADCNL